MKDEIDGLWEAWKNITWPQAILLIGLAFAVAAIVAADGIFQ